MEERIDRHLSAHDRILQSYEEKIDFFIRTSLPPVEGVLFEGQVLDARLFAENLIKTARQEIILIDNYIDASDFDILDGVRQSGDYGAGDVRQSQTKGFEQMVQKTQP